MRPGRHPGRGPLTSSSASDSSSRPMDGQPRGCRHRHKDLRRDANAAAWGYVTLRFDYAMVVHDWGPSKQPSWLSSGSVGTGPDVTVSEIFAATPCCGIRNPRVGEDVRHHRRGRESVARAQQVAG